MKIEKITGKIRLLSGLHIGGGDDTMKIGGIDNQVVKHPNTGEPYIPGSSIKGKMRSLLEWHFGLVNLSRPKGEEGKPFSSKYMDDEVAFSDETLRDNAVNLLKLFGDPNPNTPYGITRMSVGDCFITEEMRQKHHAKVLSLSEAKFENVIDRCSGTANNPRQTERVPAGVEFAFDIRYKVLPDDDEGAFIHIIETGMDLLEKDYLGGSGSRGYGRIEFKLG